MSIVKFLVLFILMTNRYRKRQVAAEAAMPRGKMERMNELIKIFRNNNNELSLQKNRYHNFLN